MNRQQNAALAGADARVVGVTGDTTVKDEAGILWAVSIANGDAAVQTLTIKDGATTKHVLRVPPGDSRTFELGLRHATSIVVNPSDTELEALVLYS